MVPSLLNLSLDKFITTFVPNNNSKEYFKQNLGSDFHHLICQRILQEHRSLLSHLAYFTDPDTWYTPWVYDLAKHDSTSQTKVANLLLSTFPNLKKLNLDYTKIQLDQLNPPKNSQLEELKVYSYFTMSEEDLKGIKDKFPYLKRFYATPIASLNGLPSTIEELALTDCLDLPLEAFTAAKNLFPHLKKITLTHTQGSLIPTLLTGLPELPPQVEEINFRGCKAIPEQVFETLKDKYPNLKKINLSGTSIESLTGLPPQLEELILNNSYISTEKIEILKDQCPKLKILNLINTTSMLNLSGLPATLEELNLCSCQAIPEQEFVTIKTRCPNLKKIELDGTRIKSLKGLEGLPLEWLSLAYCKDIPAQEFETLKAICPHLKKIRLSDTHITSLKGLPSKLDELQLNDCGAIPAEEFETLKDQSPKLKKILLYNTKIKSLAGLPATLEEIYLYGCKEIPAAEFLTIKEKFPDLRTIHLQGTQINSLEGLKGMPHLNDVIVNGYDDSKADISLFKKMYPHVRIE